MTIKRIRNAVFNRWYSLLTRCKLSLCHATYGHNLFVMNSMPRISIMSGSNVRIGNYFTINSQSIGTAWYCKSAIYVGNNEIIHARTYSKGIAKTKLTSDNTAFFISLNKLD